MKMRHRRKQFWWTWHQGNSGFVWGVARIKHQQIGRTK